MNTADPAKVVLAFTRRLFAVVLPITVLPKALKLLPAATVTAALAKKGAEKFEVACTVSAWLLLLPIVMLLLAVTGALAEKRTGALNAPVALTVRSCRLLVPSAVLPVADSKPATLTALAAVMAALAVIGAVAV